MKAKYAPSGILRDENGTMWKRISALPCSGELVEELVDKNKPVVMRIATAQTLPSPWTDDEREVTVIAEVGCSGVDLGFVYRWLHFNSHESKLLTVGEHLHAFSLGNGYGNQTKEQLAVEGLTWDWSHIRDSSCRALSNITAYLKTLDCVKATLTSHSPVAGEEQVDQI